MIALAFPALATQHLMGDASYLETELLGAETAL